MAVEIAGGRADGARHDHASRAEQYASHAIALLADSFLWGEHAIALEERGDAYRLQERHALAMADYANAIWGYLRATDVEEAERLLRYFLPYVQEYGGQTEFIAQAFGCESAWGLDADQRAKPLKFL
jgi:hypothetical protein